MAVGAFYRQFSDKLAMDEKQFRARWEEVGRLHFYRYLRGELTFEEQKRRRMLDLLSGTAVKIDHENALEFFQVYLDHFEKSWEPFEDVVPCLERLRGRPLGVITNGDSTQQREKLRRMKIAGYFQVVVVSGEIGVSKPNPEIFHSACRMAGRKPEECVYIGDNLETDILACERAGMPGVWLNRRGNQLESHARTIRSLEELHFG